MCAPWLMVLRLVVFQQKQAIVGLATKSRVMTVPCRRLTPIFLYFYQR